jgi:hypothetical protein
MVFSIKQFIYLSPFKSLHRLIILGLLITVISEDHPSGSIFGYSGVR